MSSSPSRPPVPPAAEEVEESPDVDMGDGEAPRPLAAEAGGGAKASRTALGSGEEAYGEGDEEDDDSDDSDDSGDEDEDSEEEEEDEDEDSEEEEAEDQGQGSEEDDDEDEESDEEDDHDDADDDEDDDDGEDSEEEDEMEVEQPPVATCCVCIEPCTSDGAHRICCAYSCIPCGHVYGRSCLERWLQRCGNIRAKCPQCDRTFKHKHIINLYSMVHLGNDYHKEIRSKELSEDEMECKQLEKQLKDQFASMLKRMKGMASSERIW